MNWHCCIHLLSVLLLSSATFAQQDLRSRLRRTGPIKFAGIYHYGQGTWTRPGAIERSSELGAIWSTIYDNTVEAGYFAAVYPGEYWTDEGRIPSPTSPDKIFSESQASTGAGFVGAVDECPAGPSSAPGSAAGSSSAYTIDGFQIGYCSNSSAPTDIRMEFRETTVLDGVRCAERRSTAPAPIASFTLTNFPGGGGSQQCWTMSVDLTGWFGGTGFSMKADGTGSYANPARSSELEHLFSWTFHFPTNPIPTLPFASGFFFAGNPANSTVGPNQPTSGTPNTNGWLVEPGAAARAGYDGTVWDKHGANAPPSMFNGGTNGSRGAFDYVIGFGGNLETGTGMSTQDCVRIDNPSQNPLGQPNGSYKFGGPGTPPTAQPLHVFTSFYLELYTTNDTAFPSPPGTGFCYGDGCAFTCPCSVGTIPDPQGHHESGCANGPSFGANTGSMLTASGSSNPFAGESVVLSCQIDFASPFQSPLAHCVKGNARLVNGAFPANNDGVRCVDGALIRFGSHFAGSNGNAPGFWSYPTSVGAETIPVSIRGGSSNGQTAWYQVFHRNTPNSFCFSDSLAGTSWSNGMIIKWGAP